MIIQYESKLLLFLILLRDKCENFSQKESLNLIELLQEPSHSFGLKCFSDIEDIVISGADGIYGSEAFSYYVYERRLKGVELYSKLTEEYEFKNNIDKHLLLILDVFEQLLKEEIRIGKIISLYLSDLVDDPAQHSFYPINNLMDWAIKEIEINVFRVLHIDIIDNGAYKDYYGWFYWFCYENEFGKRGLSISNNNESIKIKSKEDFVTFLVSLI